MADNFELNSNKTYTYLLLNSYNRYMQMHFMFINILHNYNYNVRLSFLIFFKEFRWLILYHNFNFV